MRLFVKIEEFKYPPSFSGIRSKISKIKQILVNNSNIWSIFILETSLLNFCYKFIDKQVSLYVIYLEFLKVENLEKAQKVS